MELEVLYNIVRVGFLVVFGVYGTKIFGEELKYKKLERKQKETEIKAQELQKIKEKEHLCDTCCYLSRKDQDGEYRCSLRPYDYMDEDDVPLLCSDYKQRYE